jgi:hypothetical protein
VLLAYQVRSGKLHHTRRAEKENERKAYMLCVGNVASVCAVRVPSRSQASRHGEGRGDRDGMSICYGASLKWPYGFQPSPVRRRDFSGVTGGSRRPMGDDIRAKHDQGSPRLGDCVSLLIIMRVYGFPLETTLFVTLRLQVIL